MHDRLLGLIRAFQGAVEEGLQRFLERAGMDHPYGWQEAGLARMGVLPGRPRIRYAFHGIGFRLNYGKEQIDFDFGLGGRADGFNFWWLWSYADDHPEQFPEFQNTATVERALEIARADGVIGEPLARQCDRLSYVLADLALTATQEAAFAPLRPVLEEFASRRAMELAWVRHGGSINPWACCFLSWGDPRAEEAARRGWIRVSIRDPIQPGDQFRVGFTPFPIEEWDYSPAEGPDRLTTLLEQALEADRRLRTPAD